MTTISNRRRIAFSLIAILAVIGVFVVKLIDIQVVQATELNEESLGKRAISQVLPGVRGSIYDAEGKTWVYTVAGPLTFQRAEVVVDRIAGGRVVLTAGPPAGSDVVTVGAMEVYGAELEIGGSH